MSLPPAEKLPLYASGDIREKWDPKKPEYETEISDILGEPWIIDIDPHKIWPYAEEDSWAERYTGEVMRDYVKVAIFNFGTFVNNLGETDYCSCEVSPDGEQVMIFHTEKLGININNALMTDFVKEALDAAPADPGPMSYRVRMETLKCQERIGEKQEKLNAMLQKEVTFDPNWIRWYFGALVSRMNGDGFGTNDVLREGFLEAVEKNTIVFRVVDKIDETYNEYVLEDGVFYIQTTPSRFGVKIDRTGPLVEIL
ncbi:uncharacterized protein NECHADRAFT_85382 [Fusarium vanettenii 77-13-4]|uniref:Uncharacterized protein n=1 Tax=Fusarium vanettenii (strain ATCC MYA-4622 / CBS 123669 / FGSC 9596 / NRRL 45880 / 77-13-4) TaxID=660122 RepID=C7ZJ73_FUSV7|nr:uncharacterized protein NECHADRAFT_85382 [Fusarium vanettenii 77-13-4]EEU36026.1 hypothetical protein NECHADRAFT_85382 [Fusarium vanettenii 77-13-4]